MTPMVVLPQAAKGPGSVVATPRIVYVTFGDDPLEEDIVRFHERLRDGDYFNDALHEYGSGHVVSARHVRLDAAPSELDDAEVPGWLEKHLGADAPLGTADDDTLYALYFPASTQLSYVGKSSCVWNGYHGDTRIGGTSIGYAVLPRCPPSEPGTTELRRLTLVASHEYFEWATDPFPRQVRAWHFVDSESAGWALAFAAELADLCYGRSVVPKDLGYVVQPLWSNRAAAAGDDPCQPSEGAAFAWLIPRLVDRFELPSANASEVLGSEAGVPGVVVSPGDVAVLRVDLVSKEHANTTFELSALEGGRMLDARGLELELADRSLRPGESTELRIRAPSWFDSVSVVVLSATSEPELAGSRWPIVVAPP